MKFWKVFRIVATVAFVVLILISVVQRHLRVDKDDLDLPGTPFIVR